MNFSERNTWTCSKDFSNIKYSRKAEDWVDNISDAITDDILPFSARRDVWSSLSKIENKIFWKIGNPYTKGFEGIKYDPSITWLTLVNNSIEKKFFLH